MLHWISSFLPFCSICLVEQFRWQITLKKWHNIWHADVSRCLPSSDIDAGGIVAISCVYPSAQQYKGLGLGIVAKSRWRNAAAI